MAVYLHATQMMGVRIPMPLHSLQPLQFEKFLKIEFPFAIVSVTVRDNVEFPKFLKVRQQGNKELWQENAKTS